MLDRHDTCPVASPRDCRILVSAPCGLRDICVVIGSWWLPGFVLRTDSLFLFAVIGGPATCSSARLVNTVGRASASRWVIGPFSQTRSGLQEDLWIVACSLQMSQRLGSKGTRSCPDRADPLWPNAIRRKHSAFVLSGLSSQVNLSSS